MQAGIEAHFQAIADATRLPIVLHDIPSRTNRELADDTLLRLARSERFIGLLDGRGSITRRTRLRPLLRAEFRLLSGDDATPLAYLMSGGDGCISTISNIAPDLCHALFSCCEQKRWALARDLQSRLAPLISLLSDDNPAALKTALSTLGLMRPFMRLPLIEPEVSSAREIANAVDLIVQQDLACAEA